MPDETKNPTEQTIEEEAGLPSNWLPVSSIPTIPGRQNGGPSGAPPQASTGIDNFQSGQLPPFLGLSPDLVGAGTPGPRVPTTRLMPIMPSGISQNVSAIKSVVTPLIPKSSPTPVPVVPAPIVVMQDHFYPYLASSSASSPVNQIGQLGWFLEGSPPVSGFLGGGYPNVGQYYWTNSNIASNAGWLNLNTGGSLSNANYSVNGLALFDNPGWTMTFVFKIEATLDSTLNFNMTQKSMYVGLVGTTITPNYEGVPISRPNTFVGLRYDTSTSAPSIGDSFFTYEVVANPIGTSQTRNNTQGTTQVTTTAPAAGVWHTLVITCAVQGQVTMTLDGAQSFTAAVPVVSFTGNVSAFWANNTARLHWTSGSTPPPPVTSWASGTILTVDGFELLDAAYDGTFVLAAADSDDVWFNLPVTATTQSGTAITLTGLPAFVPSFSFGNDDTAAPTQNGAYFFVDFWNYTV